MICQLPTRFPFQEPLDSERFFALRTSFWFLEIGASGQGAAQTLGGLGCRGGWRQGAGLGGCTSGMSNRARAGMRWCRRTGLVRQ